MKLGMLAFISIVAMPVVGSANAETWECTIIVATQKVILTQESDPALSDNRYVPGTVTGPYGKKYTAKVSIDGFDRRWDYVTADKTGVYAVFMGPSGLTGFYDFSNPEEKVGTREPEHILFCEESLTEEELAAEGTAAEGMTVIADAYIHAIRQKVERNWIKPIGGRDMPLCKVHVVQGLGGIILDVSFGYSGDSSATYRASIENAIYRSEPLPTPGDPALFEREINFYFEPDGSSATTIQKSSTGERSADEIEHVFQKYKDSIFNIYNRALRKNPSLAGKVIVILTISPDGQVTEAKMLSSELGDEALERKLIEKIKRFKFSKEDVQEIIVTYPIDFLPS